MEWLLAIVVMVVIFVIMCTTDQKKHNDAATARKYAQIVSDISGSYLVIKERHSALRPAFSIDADRDIVLSYTPDKTIFTAATVGGVTTGGVTNIQGGYSVLPGSKTGTYSIYYKYVRTGGYDWQGKYIWSIVLPEADFKLASKDPILKNHLVTQADLDEGKKHGFEYLQPNAIICRNLSKDTAQHIISWVCKEI